MPQELTPRIVAGLKPKPGRVLNVRDGSKKGAGLELRLFPSGKRSWGIRYRIGSRQRYFRLGDASVIPLGGEGGARDLARKAMQRVANGHDPAEDKKARREADTVAEFAEVFMSRYSKAKKRSWKNDLAILKADVLPKWKHRAMREIAKRDIRELLEAIVDRGAAVHANRVHALLGVFFRFAVEQEVVDHNPVRDVKKPGVERVRERFLTPEEIKTFWTVTEAMPLVLRAVWQIRLLTAQRPQEEVAQMQWGEVDLDTAWWTIPGTKTKNKRTHTVPLSAPVVALLTEIRPPKVAPEDFVFTPFTRDKRVRGASDFKLPDFQPRDLRKTAKTLMSQDEVPREWTEAVLNHAIPGIAGTYDMHSYDPQKKKALDHLARRVDAIVKGEAGAKVLPFVQRA